MFESQQICSLGQECALIGDFSAEARKLNHVLEQQLRLPNKGQQGQSVSRLSAGSHGVADESENGFVGYARTSRHNVGADMSSGRSGKLVHERRGSGPPAQR